MKIRAVFFKPDHTNKIVELNKKKHRVDGKQFFVDGTVYFINDKHFQITHKRLIWTLWIVKIYFTTYYYKEGSSNPIAVPNFDDIVKSGVEGAELAAIFDPWFLRTISQPSKTLIDQLGFYVSVATFLGVAYLVWKIHSGEPVDGSEVPAPPVSGGEGATE